MELDLKIQNIIDTDPNNHQQFAVTHHFEVEDASLIQKRGKLFTVLSVQASENFDLKPAVKIFLDSIRDNYYRNIEDTPLNSIEKAINRAYQLLLSIKSRDEKEHLNSPTSQFEISFCVALIWNKVLYVSYIGKPTAYIIRGSGVRNITSVSSGNEIWTNSSILDNEDVILIGTQAFGELFPPNEVISKLSEVSDIIKTSHDKNIIAATLIKIAGDPTDTKKQKVSSATLLEKLYIKGSLSTAANKIKEAVYTAPMLSDKFKIYQRKKTAPVSSITGILSTAQPEQHGYIETSKRIRLKRKSRKSVALIIGSLLLAVIVFGSYQMIAQSGQAQNTRRETSPTDNIQTNAFQNNRESEKPSVTPTAPEPTQNAAYFSAKSENTDISLSDIAVRDNDILLVDKNNKKIYLYTPKTKETKQILNNIEGYEQIRCDSTLCYIYENKRLLVFNPKTPEKVDPYLVENITGVNDIHPYLNNAYFLTSDDIYTLKLQGNAPTKWLSNSEKISGAISFAIDGNVYVLSGKQVEKFFGGKKTGTYDLSEHLINPSQIEVDAKNLYILDQTKKAIVVFNKTNLSFTKEINLADKIGSQEVEKFGLHKADGKTFSLIYKIGDNLYLNPL